MKQDVLYDMLLSMSTSLHVLRFVREEQHISAFR